MSSKVDISLCDIQKIALLVFTRPQAKHRVPRAQQNVSGVDAHQSLSITDFTHLRAVRLKNAIQAFHFPTAISQYFEIMIVAEIDDS